MQVLKSPIIELLAHKLQFRRGSSKSTMRIREKCKLTSFRMKAAVAGFRTAVW